ANEAGRWGTLAQGRATRAEEADRVQGPRRLDYPRLPHAAARARSEESAHSDDSAWRPMGAGRVGLRSGSPISCEPRLCSAASKFSWLDRLRPEILGSIIQAMG